MATPPPGYEKTTTTTVPETAQGWRLVYSGTLVLAGLAAVVLGIALSLPTAVRVALVLGGFALATAFGFIMVGARRVGSSKNLPGAELPTSETVTTRLRIFGFPKQGESPGVVRAVTDGDVPPSRGEAQGQPTAERD